MANPDTLTALLKEKIAAHQTKIRRAEVGHVVRVGDGVATAVGLANVRAQELVEFEGGVKGLAFNLEEDSVGLVVLGDERLVHEGDTVQGTNRVLSVPVGEALVGRVVNPLGEPLDGKGAVKTEEFGLVERPAPGVIDREGVNTPILTGIKAIDALTPIGRGQRELIIGDRQIGKTTLAIDTIVAQKFEPPAQRPICVYVAVGQKQSKIAKIVYELESRGALDYTIVVVASASDPAPLLYLAPFSGTAMAEFFRDRGQDALIIYDDLSKQAWAYRQLALLLRRPPGREAYPGDIFYLHSRLLERAAKLSPAKGGGSLTALPIIETQAGDISAYIPTNVISITDGQIYLEPELFYQGTRPAMNVGLSVSRVGSAAQTKAMKKVAGKLKLELAQFRDLAAFQQFSAELDKATRDRIERGKRITEVLKQRPFSPVPFEKQVAIIYAVNNGYLDEVAVAAVSQFEPRFLDFLAREHAALLTALREKKDLTPEIEAELKQAAADFLKVFKKND